MTTEADAQKEMNEAVYDSWQRMTDVAHMLRGYASSFDHIGNERFADKLDEIASLVDVSANRVRSAWGNALADTVRQSEQSTANMINAVLAVATRPNKAIAEHEARERTK